MEVLEELHLDRNNISKLREFTFPQLQSLRELTLMHNKIQIIEEYAFASVPR